MQGSGNPSQIGGTATGRGRFPLPLSSVQAYWNPEQLEAAYAAANVELTLTSHAPFEARVVRVEFEKIWMQQVYERAPRVKHATQTPGRAFIKFLPLPGQELVTQGAALPFDGVLRHSEGHCYNDRTTREVNWAGMSLPVETLVTEGIAVGGCDLTPPRNYSVVVPPSDAMTRLRRLHAATSALAEKAPAVLEAPSVARGLEQSLMEALVACLSGSDVRETTWGQRSHETIMRRFYRLLEDNPDRAIYMPEICVAIRVPERTLRICSHEHLGMSPKHYLLLRRMNLAHRALRLADATDTTVTEVATRFGFWHFGRFAGEYRAIFGERPSVTLGHQPN